MRRVRTRLSLRQLAAVTLLAALGMVGFVAVWLPGGGVVSRTAPGLWAALGCGALLVIGVVTALVFRFRRDPRVVVRRLARSDPALAEDLWSALELGAEAQPGDRTQAFVGCHTAAVARRLAGAPPELVVDLSWAGRAAWLLVVVVTVSALGVAFVPGALQKLLAGFGAARGDRLPVLVSGSGVTEVRIGIRPPRYTGLPREVVTPGRTPIAILRGSQVTVQARAPRPVTAAQALLPGGRLVPATLLGESTFRVRFVPRREGPVVFAYRAESGEWHLGETGPLLTIRRDLPPEVTVQPADPTLPLPRARILPLRWEANDDYGLVEVRLAWRTDLGDQGTQVLGRGPRFGKERRLRLAGELRWDLRQLKLTPGQSVRFHLEARDNRSLGSDTASSQQSRSPEQTVVIVGPTPPERQLLAALAKLLDRAAARLADRLEQDSRLTCDRRLARLSKARPLEQRLALDLGELLRVARAASRVPPLLQASLKGPVAKLQQLLLRVLQADRRAASALGKVEPCKGIAALLPRHDGVVRALEDLVLQLDELVGRATLERMQALGERIAQLQKELDRLSAELRRHPSKELQRRIAKRLERLRQLLGELSQLWGSLQDEQIDQHVNRYALDRRKTDRLLDRLSRQAGKGKPSTADLQDLKQRMERLKKALTEGLDSFRRYFPLPGERALHRSGRAVRELAEAQRKLNRQLDSGGQKPGPGLAPRQSDLARKTEKLGQSLPGDGPGSAAKLLQEAARHMREAAKQLSQGREAKSARAAAQASADALERAAKELERQGRLSSGADGAQNDDQGKVEIPPAGGALPRELRQLILEGGRTAWPTGHRRALKRYYERLLR